MSDGIVEATDVNGKLFGFERIQELLRESASAAELARAAQMFGQEDDISVIAITRTEAKVTCPSVSVAKREKLSAVSN